LAPVLSLVFDESFAKDLDAQPITSTFILTLAFALS
jgi:hypothetical protein